MLRLPVIIKFILDYGECTAFKFSCILNTATFFPVTVSAGSVDTIELRNAITLSTLYVHASITTISCVFRLIMLTTVMAKQHHTIEIFSANCPLCKHITDEIQIGKCEGCNQVVYDISKMTEEIKQKMKTYGIKSVPTTIIDGEIKVVGIPDFPWICSEDMYTKLKKDYPLKH